MRAVVQRVSGARLSVGGREISRIGTGFVVYLGVTHADTEQEADYIAGKIARLRVMEDDAGKMNRALSDCGGEVLLVSQFTLYGDCSHGNRPSFTQAARPERAEPLYERVAAQIAACGIPVRCGVFGADMTIEQTNIGPVTMLLESEK